MILHRHDSVSTFLAHDTPPSWLGIHRRGSVHFIQGDIVKQTYTILQGGRSVILHNPSETQILPPKIIKFRLENPKISGRIMKISSTIASDLQEFRKIIFPDDFPHFNPDLPDLILSP